MSDKRQLMVGERRNGYESVSLPQIGYVLR